MPESRELFLCWSLVLVRKVVWSNPFDPAVLEVQLTKRHFLLSHSLRGQHSD